MRKISPSVKSVIDWLAFNKVDDIFGDKALKLLNSPTPKEIKNTPKIKTVDLISKSNQLIGQLPEGIFNSVKSFTKLINSTSKNILKDSINYSPLVLTFKELKPCKPMKFYQGNIITGRDQEIDTILLTLCKKSKRGVILIGDPGVGKAQPVDSTVLTPSGWIKIKNLKVGDSVLCPDNTESKILGIFPQGKKIVNELTFSDGRKTECCNEHLWKIYSKNWKKAGDDYRVTETKVIKRIKTNTIEKLYIDLVKPIEQKDIVLEIDPYILGVLIGDGSLTKGPQFTKQDKEIRDRVKGKLDKGYTLNEFPDRNTITASIVSDSNNLHSNKYRNFIKSVGLDVLSKDKYIPQIYLNSSINSRIELLRGLMDTDGTVGKNGNLSYSTSSKMLADNIIYLVRSLGGIATISEKIPTFTYKDKKKVGLKSYRVAIRIPNPKNYVTLKRKQDRIPGNYQYNDLKLEISNIKEIGEKECACIYIDHPDHLYITNDFIVTHNTALVQAINARLIQRTVPRQLIGCEILEMNVPMIFSKYKEDPIGAIIGILEKASEYDKAILFIDEIHQLLSQRMNDILKPYLTEKIRFIGSTTINEYHSIITEDTALERRFTIVHVNEPNISETVNMVKGTKSVFEEHHKCSIPDDICDYLVTTGSRFLGHRKNPDKSLDLMDISCSIMYEQEIQTKHLTLGKTGDFLNDLEINPKEIASIHSEAGNRVLSKKYVDLAISNITGIDYSDIANSLDYRTVCTNINKLVFGQSPAVDTLSNIVNIFKHVTYDRERPVSIILMVGPAGVGKKLTSQILAKNLFGSNNCFIDYDMSSFKDAFTITELKGAPPGYVGYAKSGSLIKAIRTNPLSVIYLRGIDKAHETIRQYLIDGCRSGKLVDSAEREAKLNNSIIIFSVTLSDSEYSEMIKGKKNRTMGFGSTSTQEDSNGPSKDLLIPIIGNELVSICDEVIFFNELKDEDLKKIYNANVNYYINMYQNVDIDSKKLREEVLKDAKNGHDIIARLSSEVPKQVFNKLSNKEKANGHKKKSVKVSDQNCKNDS